MCTGRCRAYTVAAFAFVAYWALLFANIAAHSAVSLYPAERPSPPVIAARDHQPSSSPNAVKVPNSNWQAIAQKGIYNLGAVLMIATMLLILCAFALPCISSCCGYESRGKWIDRAMAVAGGVWVLEALSLAVAAPWHSSILHASAETSTVAAFGWWLSLLLLWTMPTVVGCALVIVAVYVDHGLFQT